MLDICNLLFEFYRGLQLKSVLEVSQKKVKIMKDCRDFCSGTKCILHCGYRDREENVLV